MKKIILSQVLLALMFSLHVTPSLAQESQVSCTERKAIEVGASGQVLQTYLSDSASKKIYLDSLNERVRQSEACQKYGISITDVSLVKDTFSVAKKQNVSAAKGISGSMTPTASIIDAAVGGLHEKYNFTYNSVNGENRTVRISGCIYVEDDDPDDLKFGVLSCHPTVSDNRECPTGSDAPEEKIHALCDEDCIVICPDYCGYGVSAAQQHPYLIQDVTAKNCIDGYLAGLAYAKDVLGFKFKDDFYTYLLGYSQGGSVAMACQKYYESGRMSDSDKSKMNLKHTYCGDGPYSASVTVGKYVEWANNNEDLAYPSVLPLIFLAAKDSYDKDCMRTVNALDCFNPEFIANTGCMDAIKMKISTMLEINEMIWDKGFHTIDQMLSDKIIKVTYDDSGNKKIELNTESNECQCLLRAFAKNDLSVGWTPTIPMTVFHFTGDKVVPYANMELIQSKVNSGEWSGSVVKFVDAKNAYDSGGGNLYDFLSWAEMPGADVSEWDHVSVGTLFYVWFMFGGARN